MLLLWKNNSRNWFSFSSQSVSRVGRIESMPCVSHRPSWSWTRSGVEIFLFFIPCISKRQMRHVSHRCYWSASLANTTQNYILLVYHLGSIESTHSSFCTSLRYKSCRHQRSDNLFRPKTSAPYNSILGIYCYIPSINRLFPVLFKKKVIPTLDIETSQ